MKDDIARCRCGNEMVSVVMTVSGTQIYCPRCGQWTKRKTREEAVKEWNKRCEGGRRKWRGK